MGENSKDQNRFLEIIIATVVIVLLLVIAIVLRNINQAETRDSERMSEVNILRATLQLYYLDHKSYPIETEWCSVELDCDNLVSAMKEYLPEIPTDPLYSEGGFHSYQYKTTNDGLEYKIYTNLERGGPYELGSKGNFIIPSPPTSSKAE